MKSILVVILCIMMFGCAHSPMHFQLAPGTTQDDFQRTKIECGEDTGGGGFLFGPLIIVAPVIVAVESIRFAKRHKFQDCMESKGFKCMRDCPHESSIKLTEAPPPDPQVLAKWTEEIRAEKEKEWVLYGNTPNGSLLYYNPASISCVDQRYVCFRDQVKLPDGWAENVSYMWRSVKVNCADKISSVRLIVEQI